MSRISNPTLLLITVAQLPETFLLLIDLSIAQVQITKLHTQNKLFIKKDVICIIY